MEPHDEFDRDTTDTRREDTSFLAGERTEKRDCRYSRPNVMANSVKKFLSQTLENNRYCLCGLKENIFTDIVNTCEILIQKTKQMYLKSEQSMRYPN